MTKASALGVDLLPLKHGTITVPVPFLSETRYWYLCAKLVTVVVAPFRIHVALRLLALLFLVHVTQQ